MIHTISKGTAGALIAAGMLALPAASFAGVASYLEPASTMTAAGGAAASPNFALVSVVGQPGVTGNSSSAGFLANHGFLPALGGWRILYPVISATPGVLSFTLMAGGKETGQVALGNAGGGTLQWSVSKGNPGEAYFSVAPESGTGNATLTFSADATGLAAGSYSDTFTIGGAGISETVQVQLNLTVTPSSYHLTVTLVSDTPGKGGGSLHSSPLGISCSGTGSDPVGQSGNCAADFIPGTTVTLHQTPDTNSTWATWSVAACGTGQDCQVVMDANRQVTATFPYAHLCKVDSSGARFDSLASSLASAAANDTILARDVVFEENLVFQGKVIRFQGGLSAWYLPQNAETVLKGRLSIRGGSLRARGLVIR